jgi:hypothetical protein
VEHTQLSLFEEVQVFIRLEPYGPRTWVSALFIRQLGEVCVIEVQGKLKCRTSVKMRDLRRFRLLQ